MDMPLGVLMQDTFFWGGRGAKAYDVL